MTNDDPFHLERFLNAQDDIYDQALAELRRGRKTSHWMWFIFPQLAGLGSSPIAVRYSISGSDEAKAYLQHPVLGQRLRECAETILKIEGKSAFRIFGSPDDVKLKSSMALFEIVAEPGSVFSQVLEKYYDGQRDLRTRELLRTL